MSSIKIDLAVVIFCDSGY